MKIEEKMKMKSKKIQENLELYSYVIEYELDE
jgi:hypothetical protein